jgi:hypothetical protein
MVGIPGEDIGTTAGGRDVGRVVARAGSGPPVSYRYQSGDQRGLRFGSYFVSW